MTFFLFTFLFYFLELHLVLRLLHQLVHRLWDWRSDDRSTAFHTPWFWVSHWLPSFAVHWMVWILNRMDERLWRRWDYGLLLCRPGRGHRFLVDPCRPRAHIQRTNMVDGSASPLSPSFASPQICFCGGAFALGCVCNGFGSSIDPLSVTRAKISSMTALTCSREMLMCFLFL